MFPNGSRISDFDFKDSTLEKKSSVARMDDYIDQLRQISESPLDGYSNVKQNKESIPKPDESPFGANFDPLTEFPISPMRIQKVADNPHPVEIMKFDDIDTSSFKPSFNLGSRTDFEGNKQVVEEKKDKENTETINLSADTELMKRSTISGKAIKEIEADIKELEELLKI